MKRKQMKDDPNFSREAQNKFDALCECESWTWSGLVKAFSKRLNDADFGELKSLIDIEASERNI